MQTILVKHMIMSWKACRMKENFRHIFILVE